MKLTLKNIWDNRELFIQKCKEEEACEGEFKRLLQAQSKEDFMQVVLDNYEWVNREITKEYYYAYDFFEGFAVVELDNKMGLIDKFGNIFIPLVYDSAYAISDGLAKVKLGNKNGFIDTNGNVVVPIIYDFASNFSDGLAAVKLEGKWGFVDRTGNVAIPIIYDDVACFYKRVAKVKLNGEYFKINKGNERVAE